MGNLLEQQEETLRENYKEFQEITVEANKEYLKVRKQRIQYINIKQKQDDVGEKLDKAK